MFRRFSVNFALLSILLDSLIVFGSLYLASALRPLLNDVGTIKTIDTDFSLPVWLYPAFVLVWVGTYLGASIYDGRRQLRRNEELTTFTLASMFAVIASAGILYLTYREMSRALFLLFMLISLIGLGGWRGLYRWLGNRFQSHRRRRLVLIVGEGEIAQLLRQQIIDNPEFGLDFMGFVGKSPGESNLGGYDQILEVIDQLAPDHVVVSLPQEESEIVSDLAGGMLDRPVRVWLTPDYLSLSLHEARVEEYAGITMLDLQAPILNDYQRMVKRGFDLFLSTLLVPFILPVMLIVAILIKIFDPGPVFYLSPRVGGNGRLFNMLKFRTMVVDADKKKSSGGAEHKTKGDSRVTGIGRFLRRTSLDELPQIFNVLRGEMSLVGPRPELPELVEKYEDWQRVRFSVPPGITGWWQVNGRSDRPMHLHTEDDLYYIKNYSIWLDIQILIRTAWVVVIGRGAY